MTAKALVTGLRGFTGRYMARELSAMGYQVVSLSGRGIEDAESSELDLRDRVAVNSAVTAIQPEVVVHLAAVAYVAHGDVNNIYTSNIVGSRNLLSALAGCDKPPKKILLASSANVYGNARMPTLDETCPARPENDYAISKYAMELMARQYRDDLPITIARPFNYTGVGQSPEFLLPKLVRHFAQRAPTVELGNIDVYRDFNDVRMVAAVYGRLLEKGESGEIYNVCTGAAYSIRDVLGILADLVGYSIEVIVNPSFVRDNEVKRLVGSNRKLVECIGKISQIPLNETLEWMYRDLTDR
ncbi:MAG: NAD-dependent epimerase/dehydratase family protein [Pseudomonadota bacterium]